jgi:D-alanine-D-alanine ligase
MALSPGSPTITVAMRICEDLRMRVALLANLKKNAPTWPGMSPDQWDDLDSEETIEAILTALLMGGHHAEFLEADLSLLASLAKYQPDICFNLAEGHWGDGREAQIPALLEMMRIPYTGSRVLTLALALDKPMTKRVLSFHGLPTPSFQTFERVDEPLDPDMTFPMFVKPSREGTGMGVSAASIVHNETELRRQLREIIARYRQPALVERFINGREITVGVVGNLQVPVAKRLPDDEEAPRVLAGLNFLPPLEIDLDRYPEEEASLYTGRVKTELSDDFYYLCPAPLLRELEEELQFLTAAVVRVLGCVDVARVDFRLDRHENNKPYILEVNPLPGLNPRISDLVIEARADQVSHAELINSILLYGAARQGVVPYGMALEWPAVRLPLDD